MMIRLKKCNENLIIRLKKCNKHLIIRWKKCILKQLNHQPLAFCALV